MERKEQFDVLLGGSKVLPKEVHIMKLVSSRASEIAAMTYSIENPQQTKLVFQKLPVYMRRRVMSHNAKRLPRKLREAHLNQMSKSGLPPKTKRPSRRYRRRPRNLLSEYNRRQRSKVWLETHIWHAKRFHMTEKWGYRLADYANDKCFKANYRAVTKHCLMQDISYYTCMEIVGPEVLLKDTLKTHCNPRELTFAARVYAAGDREGSLMFFKRNGYPKHPIGRIHFLWRPKQSELKTIWLWVHPAFIEELLAELITSFEFKPQNEGGTLSYHNDKSCILNILKGKLNRFRLLGPLTLNTITNSLQIPTLDDKFLVKTSSSNTDSENEESSSDNTREPEPIDAMAIDECERETNVGSCESWHYSYYNAQENVESLKMQKQLWEVLKTLDSPSQLPPNIAFGLTVLDPRFYLPDTRVKTKRKIYNADILPIPPTNVNHSPIWEADIRHNVTNSCKSASAINKLRSKCLVPGKDNDCHFNQNIMAKIPILLIQSPGFTDSGLPGLPISVEEWWWENELQWFLIDKKYSFQFLTKLQHRKAIHKFCIMSYSFLNPRSQEASEMVLLFMSYEAFLLFFAGLGSGIDIILPSGWAMPFWLAFLLRCTRVGALRESKSIAFECKNAHSSEINDPDTSANARDAICTKEELMKKYLRYPPNRRVNFTKLGITSPFFCDWKLLMKEWSNTEEFFVLRERTLLSFLQAKLSEISMRRKKQKSSTELSKQSLESIFETTNCLVPIKTTIMKRGCPRRFALVCMPTADDLDKLTIDNDWSGPVEKVHPDRNEAARKKLRKNHLTCLKRLKRQRIRHRKAMLANFRKVLNQKTENVDEKIDSTTLLRSNSEIINQQRSIMSKLHLPPCTKARHSCDREVLGYLTAADFSFTEAKGVGIGYITLAALMDLIKKESNIVLVRNTQTRQYRFADLQIMY